MGNLKIQSSSDFIEGWCFHNYQTFNAGKKYIVSSFSGKRDLIVKVQVQLGSCHFILVLHILTTLTLVVRTSWTLAWNLKDFELIETFRLL